jgi:DNA-binding NarL/FixJ family response regulator
MTSTARPRILHLEDDTMFVALLARALQRSKLDVDLVTVESRGAFWAELETGTVDLVLSDRSVGDYSGVAALRDIKERAIDVPFVFLSGWNPPDGVHPYLAAGAVGYLLKDDLPGATESLRGILTAGARTPPTEPARAALFLAGAVSELAHSAAAAADLVRLIPPAAQRIAGASGASIALARRELCGFAGQDAVRPSWPDAHAPDDSLSARAIQSGEAVAIADVAEAADLPADLARGGAVRSALAIPIGRGSGAIAVYRAEPHVPSAEELAFLTALADAADMALGRARLADQDAALTEMREPLARVLELAASLRDEHATALDQAGRAALDELARTTGDLGRMMDRLLDLELRLDIVQLLPDTEGEPYTLPRAP